MNVLIIIKLIFFFSLVIILYTYFCYPLLLYILTKIKNKLSKDSKVSILPDVSLIIAAYNEEKKIREKIQNSLELNYPQDKIEIFVGSDGSTDKTIEILSQFTKTISVFEFPENEGKLSVIEKIIPFCMNSIIIITDVDVILHRDAIKELVSKFEETDIGGVSGTLFIKNEKESLLAFCMSLYLRFEKFQRKCQSILGSSLSFHGPIYAFRKELFTPEPGISVTEDMFQALNIQKKGYRVAYCEKSIAYGEATSNLHNELKRKIRISMDSYNCYKKMRSLLWCSNWTILFHLWSYKIIRDLSSLCFLLLFLSNFIISGENIYYWVLLWLQCLFYIYTLGRILGIIKIKNQIYFILFELASYLTIMNIGRIIGLKSFLFTRKRSCWKITR